MLVCILFTKKKYVIIQKYVLKAHLMLILHPLWWMYNSSSKFILNRVSFLCFFVEKSYRGSKICSCHSKWILENQWIIIWFIRVFQYTFHNKRLYIHVSSWWHSIKFDLKLLFSYGLLYWACRLMEVTFLFFFLS